MRKVSMFILLIFLVSIHSHSQWFIKYNDSMLIEKQRLVDYNSTYGEMVSDTIYSPSLLKKDEIFYKKLIMALKAKTINSLTRFSRKNRSSVDLFSKTDNGKNLFKLEFGLNFSKGTLYAKYEKGIRSYGIMVDCQATFKSIVDSSYTFRYLDIYFVRNNLLKWIDTSEPLLVDARSSWSLKSPSYEKNKTNFEGNEKVKYPK